ncbi:hypothetical protein [Longispora albida]|uniref:hypothetical protein n=1 Tax=Longispora albida TaxID=203523 RepID=UPI00036C7EBD|nr:hypothetical protein [Longispora albida]
MNTTTTVPVGGHLLRKLLWCGATCRKPLFPAVMDGAAVYRCSCLVLDAEAIDEYVWRQFEDQNSWLAGAVPPRCRGEVLGRETGAITYRPRGAGFQLIFE